MSEARNANSPVSRAARPRPSGSAVRLLLGLCGCVFGAALILAIAIFQASRRQQNCIARLEALGCEVDFERAPGWAPNRLYDLFAEREWDWPRFLLPAHVVCNRISLTPSEFADLASATAALQTISLSLMSPISDLGPLRSNVQLEELDLVTLTDADMATITSLRKLRLLSAWDARLTLANWSAVASLPNLEWLDIGGGNLDDAGMRRLAAARHLRDLWVGGVNITDASIPVLKSLPKLECFYGLNTSVSCEALEELAKRKPDFTHVCSGSQ